MEGVVDLPTRWVNASMFGRGAQSGLCRQAWPPVQGDDPYSGRMSAAH